MTKTYVVYPGSSVIREWAEFKNLGSVPLKIPDPEFLSTSARLGDRTSLDFDWIDRRQQCPWLLGSENRKLDIGKPRRFDSYDPFPVSNVCGDFVDGKPNIAIQLNGEPVWPAAGQIVAQNATRVVAINAAAEVRKGDRIVFLVKPNRAFDTLEFAPTITYGDGETHVASREFSTQQGDNGWHYQFSQGGDFKDLVLGCSRQIRFCSQLWLE